MKANRLIGFLVGILIPWIGGAAEAVFQPNDTIACCYQSLNKMAGNHGIRLLATSRATP